MTSRGRRGSIRGLSFALLLGLAGCSTLQDPERWRQVRTRYYTILTDVAPTASPGIAEVASLLDLGVERLCARLGRACPPKESLRARLFSTREGFDAHERTPAEEDFHGFYDESEREIAAPLDGRCNPQWPPRRDHGRLPVAHVLLHEITHQLMHDALATCPHWLSEGLAELHPRRALPPDDDGLPMLRTLRSLYAKDWQDALVILAIWALHGQLFDGSMARVRWRPSNYLASLGLVGYLADHEPHVLRQLVHGRATSIPPGLEAAVARWSRLEVTRSLLDGGKHADPAVADLLGLLWGRLRAMGRELRSLAADDARRLRLGLPSESPALLRERLAPPPDALATIGAAIGALDLEPRDLEEAVAEEQ